MNQKGYSWPEAILTLTVIMIVFGTLLPLATKMTSTLYNKKLDMYAAETLFHGAILYNSYGINNGVQHIEGQDYEWIVNGQSICVYYKGGGKPSTRCIQF